MDFLLKDLGSINYDIGKNDASFKQLQKEYKKNKFQYILNCICLVFLIVTFVIIFGRCLYCIFIKQVCGIMMGIQLTGVGGIAIIYTYIFDHIDDDYHNYNISYYDNIQNILDNLRGILKSYRTTINKIESSALTLSDYNKVNYMLVTVELNMNTLLKDISKEFKIL